MNFLARLLVVVPLVYASQSIAPLSLREDSVCTDTHIFLARGWNEDYPGRQKSFVAEIITALSSETTSADYEDILYYSSFQAVYCDSISEGVANGLSQIVAYNKRCPDSKLVVSGYSQGAYVVGDIFAGGGGTFGDCVQKSNAGLSVDSDAGKMVTAILVWGSKRHTASQPYNTFSGADKNGIYPRPDAELDALKQWTPVLRDYCVVTDPNCAGGSVIEDHWNYFELYSDQAVEWIKNQVENNVTAKSLVRGSSTITTLSTNTTSSDVSSSSSQSSITTSETSATTQTLPSPSTISQVFSNGTSTSSSENAATTTQALSLPSTVSQNLPSATSTSSSGSAAATSYQISLLGLAVAGSLAVYV